MNSFIVLAAALACVSGSPQFLGYNPYTTNAFGYGYSALGFNGFNGLPYTTAVHTPAIVAPAFTKTQYHAQDEFGQSSHGYAHPGQAAAEVRDAAGNVRGSYAYINPEGKEIRVNYVADQGGFRVESNALPVGPSAGPVAQLALPQPVQDTPEVVEARAAHARAVEEVRARRSKRGLTYAYPGLTHPLTYSAVPHTLGYNTLGYNTLGYSHVAGVPAYTTAYTSPLAYSTTGVVAAPAHFRAATLTKVINTPGHAVSYRVD